MVAVTYSLTTNDLALPVFNDQASMPCLKGRRIPRQTPPTPGQLATPPLLIAHDPMRSRADIPYCVI